MSRAFIRENDGDDPFDHLPERPISVHPNFVTSAGRAQIEKMLADLQTARHTAQTADDKAALAHIERDLRYWLQRRASAQLVPVETNPAKVRFGVRVTLLFDECREQAFKIVGEDEADPTHGLISWQSPVAQSLLGREIGDTVNLPAGRAEIIALAAD